MHRLVLCTVLVSGCFRVPLAFHCDDRKECVLAGVKGECERSGYCSFPDPTCPSQRSYRGDAPAPYTNQCVVEDAAVPDDLAQTSVDLGGADSSMDLAREGCGYPQLLVTVEDHESLPVGKVLRFQLAPGAMPSECGWLDGSGRLSPLPHAVAKIGNGTGTSVRIAVAGRHSMTLIEPERDTIVQEWVVGQSSFPMDVAPVWQATDVYAAVAYSTIGAGYYLASLSLYKEGVLTPIERTPAELGVENGYGMTTDPWNSGALVMLDLRVTDPQALESVNPFSMAVTPYLDDPSGYLFSLAGYRVGAGAYFAWSAGTQMVTLGESAWSPVFDGGAPVLSQLTCPQCTELIHTVPDPTNGKTAFLLCAGTTEYDRKIYRATNDPAPSCVQIYDGGKLTYRFRLSHLGIARP